MENTCSFRVEMKVSAYRLWVAAAVILQASINRRNHFLQTLDSISHIAIETLTAPLVGSGENTVCEIAAAAICLLYTAVNRLANMSVSGVSRLTGTGNVDT